MRVLPTQYINTIRLAYVHTYMYYVYVIWEIDYMKLISSAHGVYLCSYIMKTRKLNMLHSVYICMYRRMYICVYVQCVGVYRVHSI